MPLPCSLKEVSSSFYRYCVLYACSSASSTTGLKAAGALLCKPRGGRGLECYSFKDKAPPSPLA